MQVSDSWICYHCGQAAGSVFVHGHYQCLACRSVQIPCCDGAAVSATSAEVSLGSDLSPGRNTKLP